MSIRSCFFSWLFLPLVHQATINKTLRVQRRNLLVPGDWCVHYQIQRSAHTASSAIINPTNVPVVSVNSNSNTTCHYTETRAISKKRQQSEKVRVWCFLHFWICLANEKDAVKSVISLQSYSRTLNIESWPSKWTTHSFLLVFKPQKNESARS